MNNNNEFINANIYPANPLLSLFESSADSAAPAELHTAEAPTTSGARNPANPPSNAIRPNAIGRELMAPLMNLKLQAVTQAATTNAEGVSQVIPEAYIRHDNPTLYPPLSLDNNHRRPPV